MAARAGLIAALLVGPAAAAPGDAHVAANLRATLYHELGHAMLFLGDHPTFGQEEDAADIFTALMIDRSHPEAEARAIMEAVMRMWRHLAEEEWYEPWDPHDAAERRLYAHLCIFAGADPLRRRAWAEGWGLPAGRLEACADEFALASWSWEGVLEESRGPHALRLEPSGIGAAEAVLREEVEALSELGLPAPLGLRISACTAEDEVGWEAFFDPEGAGGAEIVICRSSLDWYRESAPAAPRGPGRARRAPSDIPARS